MGLEEDDTWNDEGYHGITDEQFARLNFGADDDFSDEDYDSEEYDSEDDEYDDIELEGEDWEDGNLDE